MDQTNTNPVIQEYPANDISEAVDDAAADEPVAK